MKESSTLLVFTFKTIKRILHFNKYCYFILKYIHSRHCNTRENLFAKNCIRTPVFIIITFIINLFLQLKLRR